MLSALEVKNQMLELSFSFLGWVCHELAKIAHGVLNVMQATASQPWQ